MRSARAGPSLGSLSLFLSASQPPRPLSLLPRSLPLSLALALSLCLSISFSLSLALSLSLPLSLSRERERGDERPCVTPRTRRVTPAVIRVTRSEHLGSNSSNHGIRQRDSVPWLECLQPRGSTTRSDYRARAPRTTVWPGPGASDHGMAWPECLGPRLMPAVIRCPARLRTRSDRADYPSLDAQDLWRLSSIFFASGDYSGAGTSRTDRPGPTPRYTRCQAGFRHATPWNLSTPIYTRLPFTLDATPYYTRSQAKFRHAKPYSLTATSRVPTT